MSESNSFLTLTYDENHLPVDGGLDHRHWQLFAKRLRKKIGSFRFFMCGEYGDENLRPHYHACIFGVDFSGDRVLHKVERGNELYSSALLEETWGKGFCLIGGLTFESAAYVSRYIIKKKTGPQASAAYERVDPDTGEVFSVRPEYVAMSRGGRGGQGGIGSSWFAEFKSDVYPSDEVVHEGRRFRPPRFYDDKLPEEELALVKARRLCAIGERCNDPDALHAREVILEGKLKLLKRTV